MTHLARVVQCHGLLHESMGLYGPFSPACHDGPSLSVLGLNGQVTGHTGGPICTTVSPNKSHCCVTHVLGMDMDRSLPWRTLLFTMAHTHASRLLLAEMASSSARKATTRGRWKTVHCDSELLLHCIAMPGDNDSHSSGESARSTTSLFFRRVPCAHAC
jgi:hypothetical protein